MVRSSFFCVVLLCSSIVSAVPAGEPVVFDAPAVVIAEPVNPAVVDLPTAGGDLYRLRISVSSFVSPEFRGSLGEYALEIQSPGQTMRVLDFWPKNETYSELDGNVKVDRQQQSDQHVAFSVAAAYPTIGSANANGEFNKQQNLQESYQRKPALQLLTSSGTTAHGYGALYKFRPGPIDVLEGTKEIALLVEAPRGWRADLLQIWMTAAGVADGHGRKQVICQSRNWIATHREGDGAAAAQAQAYVRHERYLRGVAASQQSEVEKRSLPSIWHKAGAALNVVNERIPKDYLSRVIFGTANPSFNDGTSRLPVDLRVAILDYWDHRTQLLSMAQSAEPIGLSQSIARSN